MATGFNFLGSDEVRTPTCLSRPMSQTLAKGSDEDFDACCCTCLEDGRHQEAKKYCRNCSLFYCEKCLRTHNKIPSSRGHVVVDTQGSYKVCDDQTRLPTERCAIHSGKLVDMYCGDHDMVCCSECAAVRHRSCTKLERIQDVAKGIRSNAEYMQLKYSFQEVLCGLQAVRAEKLQEMSTFEAESKGQHYQINEMEEELKARVILLAQNTRDRLEIKSMQTRSEIDESINMLENSIAKISFRETNFSEGNDAQIFANVKTGKAVLTETQNILSDFMKNKNQRSVRFLPYSGIRKLLGDIDALGTVNAALGENTIVTKVSKYSATFCRKLKFDQDSSAVCVVKDNLLLQTGVMLTRINLDNFAITGELRMNGLATSLCSVGSERVAVACSLKKEIQFVTIEPSMVIAGQLKTDHRCINLVFSEKTEELFVGTGDEEVKVYDTTGMCLRSIKIRNMHGMAMGKDMSSIFVPTDKKVIVVNLAGDILNTIDFKSSSSLFDLSTPICVLPGNIILVSDGHEIYQLDQQGTKLGALLKTMNTVCLAYDSKRSLLIVGVKHKMLMYNVVPVE